MKLEYYKVVKRDHRKMHDCRFNEGCRCAVQQCWRCGWNPVVAACRQRKILKALGIKEAPNGN